ncbi:glycosyltransferase, partial [Salmonella enterica]|uniref:glycosyltransferase n=1 Tax=Salmonella enterica TaxID=28901 RepID=UPI003CF68A3B
MPSFPIEVIVRCKNEMPYVRDTVRRLSDAGLRIVAFDSGSTDGSREILASAADDLVDIEPAAYIPGRVLN